MQPAEILQMLLNVNRNAAQLIFAGLGLLAAATILTTLLGENPGLGLVAAYILGFAVVVTLISFVVTNEKMRLVLGWTTTSVMVLFMLGLVGSALRFPPSLPVPACYVQILWVHPAECEENLITDEMVFLGTPGITDLWTVQASEPSVRPAPYDGPIFLHFAPGNERGRMVSLAESLVGVGWPVRDASRGGEEVRRSPGETQIRYYSEEARTDALALARAVKALSGADGVLVRDFSRTGVIANDKLLEIWIAAPGTQS